MLNKQPADFFGAQSAKGMDEANARIELGIAGQALFDARHSNQHQAELVAIEQVAQLLQTCDLQTIGLINKDQPGGRQGRLPRSDGHVEKPCRRLALSHARKPISFEEKLLASPLLLTEPASARQPERCARCGSCWMLRRLVQRLLTPFATVLGLFTISGVYKTVSASAKVGKRFVIGPRDRGQSLETVPVRIVPS